jgi:short-subunit dehydrogenase
MKKIVIIGATSGIASETARCFALDGAELFITGRNEEKVSRLANDLRCRGARSVRTALFRAEDAAAHEKLIHDAVEVLGEIDSVLIAYGELPNQRECEQAWEKSEHSLTVNFLSPIALLTAAANYFEKRGRGNITVISSVAGDRGRQSNYIYGCAKGGLTTFLQGLRNRLYHHGVSVTTIKPGFVDTPMTAEIPKGPLFASAASVGKRIHKAMKRGECVVYTPCYWRFIMLVIQHIPETIFKRLKL